MLKHIKKKYNISFTMLFMFLPVNVPIMAATWVEIDSFLKPPEQYARLGEKLVRQGQIAYRLDNSFRFLATEAAGPGVILGMRHRASGKGFLAHISMFNEIDPASWMGLDIAKRIEAIVQGEEGEVDFYLFGGWSCLVLFPTKYSAQRFIKEVSKTISVGNIYYQPTSCSLWCSALTIDMETGLVYEHLTPRNSYQEPTFFSIAKRALEVHVSFIFTGLQEI